MTPTTCARCGASLPRDVFDSPDPRCPACGAVQPDDSFRERFVPGSPPAPPARGGESPYRRSEDYPDYDDYQGRDGAVLSGGWITARTGLWMIFWTSLFIAVSTGIFTIFAAAMGIPMGGPFGNQARPNPNQMMMQMEGLAVAMMAYGCLTIIVAIVGYVGLCLCCAVPRESGARGKAIGTAILIAVAVVLLISASTILGFRAAAQQMRGGGPPDPVAMTRSIMLPMLLISVGFTLLLVIAQVLFSLFLRRVAQCFGRPDLGRAAMWYLGASLLFTGLNLTLQILQTNLQDPFAPEPLPELRWAVTGFMFLLLSFFLVLISRIARSIHPENAAPFYAE